jgi:hypothetical protein
VLRWSTAVPSAVQPAGIRRVGIRLAALERTPRRSGQRHVAAPKRPQGLVVELFQVEQRVVRAPGGADQLVELDLHRFGIAKAVPGRPGGA